MDNPEVQIDLIIDRYAAKGILSLRVPIDRCVWDRCAQSIDEPGPNQHWLVEAVFCTPSRQAAEIKFRRKEFAAIMARHITKLLLDGMAAHDKIDGYEPGDLERALRDTKHG